MKGFTLIELSIVLVVIGLIVGGILVGRDLIKTAELRATVGQVEKFNSAVNTFRTKYNALPGDINTSMSTTFGLFTITGANPGNPGYQDGSGLIEGCGGSGTDLPCGETLIFWRHLSDANLIDGNLGMIGNSAINPVSGLTTGNVSTMAQSVPGSRMTPKNYFSVYSYAGMNYFQLGPWNGINNAGPAYTTDTVPWSVVNGVTPIDSYYIDGKIDDGMPNSGIVVARSILLGGNPQLNLGPIWAVASTSDRCVMAGPTATDPSDTYNRIPASGGNDGSCSLRFRFY